RPLASVWKTSADLAKLLDQAVQHIHPASESKLAASRQPQSMLAAKSVQDNCPLWPSGLSQSIRPHPAKGSHLELLFRIVPTRAACEAEACAFVLRNGSLPLALACWPYAPVACARGKSGRCSERANRSTRRRFRCSKASEISACPPVASSIGPAKRS